MVVQHTFNMQGGGSSPPGGTCKYKKRGYTVIPLPLYEIHELFRADEDKKTRLRQVTAFSDQDGAIDFLRHVNPDMLPRYVFFNSSTGAWKIGPVAVAEHLIKPIAEARFRFAHEPQ